MSVLIETSLGELVIDLLVDEAPRCCENFLKLCKVKYYNFAPIYGVQKDFSFQTGDPIGPGSKDSDGGSSIWGLLNGPSRKTFKPEFHKKLKHAERGTVSMATAPAPNDPDERLAGSQFIVTLGDDLDYLDGKAAIFGKVVEGFDTLEKINGAFVDNEGRPLKDIRIRHTHVLEDPYPDPDGLVEPPESPVPSAAQLATVRIADDEEIDENADPEEVEKRRREREARAQALTLEMVGDLPFAEIAPRKRALLIRDRRTGDSLQYAFIEFADRASCEQAYFKMDGVLIDDKRIRVDFSQSVSRLPDSWRESGSFKRWQERGRGGFGGIEGLEKRRQYRNEDAPRAREGRYGYVFDRGEARRRDEAGRGEGAVRGAVRESGVGVRGKRNGIVMVRMVEGVRTTEMVGEGRGVEAGKGGETGAESVIMGEVIAVDGKRGRLLVGCVGEETARSYYSSNLSSIKAESSIGVLSLEIRKCSYLVYRAQTPNFGGIGIPSFPR
ncbi:Peptidyl-prolyl cis-trans isomerase-like 4 [Coniosporium tulheliwenetii]|uniref:Peptidyl-prolyl cis-trans isomerase-like 4 n=1 Tax=Coniosporium tulheliwenetii TaxID=3383036 RepID=A0ACC2ZFI5_9PEZI|nr:Peptidyl-prolyl cis-trans isomerase-like 4 [Cladosporium sp. JES 115]